MTDYQGLFLSFNGRLGRQGFGLAAAALLVVGVVGGVLPVIGGLIGLLLLWPWSAVAAKRLHDMGRSAKWIALPLIPSLVVGAMGVLTGLSAMTGSGAAMIGTIALTGALGFVAMLIGLGFLAWIGFTPGQPGQNHWGAAPAPVKLPGLA